MYTSKGRWVDDKYLSKNTEVKNHQYGCTDTVTIQHGHCFGCFKDLENPIEFILYSR